MASKSARLCLRLNPKRSMSRRQPQLYPESHLPPEELEDEQIISGTGEGDELMEDAHGEEEEGYSELYSSSVY